MINKAVVSLIVIFGFGTLLGCSIPSSEQGSEHTQRVMIPWWSKGQYQWQSVNVRTLRNLSEVQGSSVKFFMSPQAIGNKLMGTQPRVRYFLNHQGEAVFTDELSQQLVTLYAHLEKLQDMDQEMGIGDKVKRPQVVGVNVLQTKGGKNNALYSPKFDALLFLPYVGSELPIIVNAGAIAHEHFHAVFQALVGNDLKEKVDTVGIVSHPEDSDFTKHFEHLEEINDDKVITEIEERARYHSYLLRGINEGLADVWGWVYTEDVSFIQKTWPQAKERSLAPSAGLVATKESIKRLSLKASERSREDFSSAYVLGTSYARLIRANFSRAEAGRAVIQLLGEIKKEFFAMGDEDWISPSVLPALLATKAKNKAVCEALLNGTNKDELDLTRFDCSKLPEANP